MGVTLRTADRQPEPNRAEGIGAIHRFLHAILFGIGSTFGVMQRIAMKSGCNASGVARRSAQVARELLRRECIKRQVAVDCLDHPIAITPRAGAMVVVFKAFGLRVANHVKPVLGPSFPVAGRIQKAFDHPLAGI